MTSHRWSRRSLLATSGVALAGCLGPTDGSDDGTDGTDGTDAPTGSGTVDETGTPVDSDYDLSVDHDVESWDRYEPDWSPPTDAPGDLEYETVIENLEVPWDLAFAPDGDLFISERTGSILRYDSSSLEDVAEVDVLDRADAIDPGSDDGGWWAAGSEGGLLGIAVHPNYPDVPVVYAYYTYNEGEDHYNRLVYYDVSADDVAATETVLIDEIPGHHLAHNGARLAFGPANYLWVTTGDALLNTRTDDVPGDPVPQDQTSVAGKVLRLEPDGTAPTDNPDFGEDADPRLYTIGQRNPQGISFMPDATPVITEHGHSGHDEVMVLEAGQNNGWSVAREADEYSGSEFDRPVVNTGPDETWAPTGCVFYTGDAVPALRNRLVVGTLRGQHLNVVTIYPSDGEAPSDQGGRRFDADWMSDDYDSVSHRFFPDELGRMRHAEQGPDGALYATTSNRDGRASEGFPTENDDRLVRIRPAE